MLQRSLSRLQFVNNSAVRVTTTAIFTQLVGFLLSPLIASLYGPESFGQFVFYLSASAVVSAVCSLSLHLLYLSEKDESERDFIKSAIFTALILWTFLFAILTLLVNIQVMYVWMLALSAIILQFFQNQYIVEEKYSNLNHIRLVNSLSSSGGKLLLTSFLLSPAGLVFGHCIFAFCLFFKKLKGFKFSVQNLSSRLRCDVDFIVYRSSQEVLNATSLFIPILILKSTWGVNDVAAYGLVVVLLSAPVTLVGTVCQSILVPIMNQLHHGDAGRVCTNIAVKIFLFGVIGYGAVRLADWLLAYLGYFQDWLNFSAILLAMYWMFVGQAILKPFVVLCTVKKLSKVLFQYELLAIFIKVPILLFGAFIFTDVVTLIELYVVVTCLLYLFLMQFVLRRIRHE